MTFKKILQKRESLDRKHELVFFSGSAALAEPADLTFLSTNCGEGKDLSPLRSP